MIEDRLYAKLRTVADNVYQIVAPKKYRTPAVVVNRIGTETVRDTDLDEQTAGWVTFQIDVYDPILLTSKMKARAIRAALKAWVDPTIASVTFESETDMVDDTTDVSLFRTMASYRLFVTDGL